MIGLDTNILIRYFTRDDPVQTPVADALLDSLSDARRGYVPTVVLAELVWTMDKRYGAGQPELVEIIEYLIGSSDLILESCAVVKSALRLFTATSGDFADCLIHRSCQGAGCHHTATFDRKAARSIGMKLVL
ncbi:MULTISPECIES: type II toxin-antitoxin system VapC family toxin [unclassified Cupriavidus]|uniref:PIN domain-containing protein n=1 Tax=unclassified Cupriavidus TaxID=2640874 RepID=UPI001BFFF8D0|nr:MULTISPECIES: type II toxin-antitoxin system VapC family toxin [unclassified Cupriavidus]MCA3182912.1 type II toxin-antitoxin system VapC family toxin [Cupriavidus sp.]MCA3190192.1 type II toxin-antitoxin system VapC family toxin [Cupriavidus sp.]MCA3199657.1 type II toxin-antitoxin system VapC family toxin [Cupriavidus sp.]MCA3205616.1 type II toxin-antitoxin system VapC family toxin [Cupriavidus sp.]MCA3207127.1 type II toxin-antitoxin system VapC family toxin [Cupriavidus sp.]